jgi:predicted nucleic acid-binding protein
MMISFDTNILVYATLSAPLAKTDRARDLLVRGIRTGSSILLLQTLAEFSSVAIRKAGVEVDAVRTTLDAWRAVLPVQGTQDGDLSAALDAVKKHPAGVPGCDAMGRGTTGRRSPSAYRGPPGRL